MIGDCSGLSAIPDLLCSERGELSSSQEFWLERNS